MDRLCKLPAIAGLCGLVLVGGGARADVTFDLAESNNCYPFSSCPEARPIHYQQLYSHYVFGVDPLEITGIAFKPSQGKLASSFGPTPIELTIYLSTTLTQAGPIPGDFATKPLSGSFAENLGNSSQVVFAGTAYLSSSGGNLFDIAIPFTTPYRYDPHAGNLLVGLDVSSGGVYGTPFAAGYSKTTSRNFGGTTEIGYGLATRFQSPSSPVAQAFPDVPPTSVPELGRLALLLPGLLVLGGLVRRRRRVATG